MTGKTTDSAAREQIRSELDSTLLVEAGAGTGKTTALVGRIVELISTGRARIDEIAAITFTESAAAELRDRVHAALLERLPADRAAADALDHLAEAPITTIHGFAQRLLGEFPLEAGLPLRFSVLDDVAMAVAFERHFVESFGELLDDERHHGLVSAAFVLGVTPMQLRKLAEALEEHWDCFETERPFLSSPELEARVDEAASHLFRLSHEAVEHGGLCDDPTDRLVRQLAEICEWTASFPHRGDWLDRLSWLVELPVQKGGRLGRKDRWGLDIEVVRESLAAYESARASALETLSGSVVSGLVSWIGSRCASAAAERRESGELSFHDLLVLTRNLLRDRRVKGIVQKRLKTILVDEFQDTDPLQFEIVSSLSRDEEGSFVPGRLFLVGDPKQSIYRFRGADVSLYEQARAAIKSPPVRLTTNFRSVPGILEWVNGVFDGLVFPASSTPGEKDPSHLVPSRHELDEMSVTLLDGPTEVPERAGERRSVEAQSIATVVRRAVDEGWTVDDDGVRRGAQWSDIAILVPRRTGLGELESGFEAAGVEYRLESPALIYASQEVRDLLSVLAAVGCPGDERAIIAALRSPLCDCSDEELFEYRQLGGEWRTDLMTPHGRADRDHSSDLSGHRVSEVLGRLGELSRQRHSLGPLRTLERVVEDCHVFELAAAGARARESLRRVIFVLEEARTFIDAGGESVDGLLSWMERQARSSARRVETSASLPGEDAVRILTIHGAKGLEFPIVVLSELGASARSYLRRPTVLRGPDGTVAARLGAGRETPDYALLAERAAASDEEETFRLCYVAATRARDHLVVSLRHSKASAAARASLAEVLFEKSAEQPPGRAKAVESLGAVSPRRSRPPRRGGFGAASYEAFLARRDALLERLSASPVVAASSLEKGRERTDFPRRSNSGSEDDPFAPFQRRAAASALGRAVHAVLQRLPLDGSGSIEELARAEAAREGCEDRLDDVVALAAAARRSPVVAAAASAASVWREVPITVPFGERYLEAVVDLVFEEDGGLVVVDYKTDALDSPDRAAHAGERYRLQAGAYALALETATTKRVNRAVLVFVAAPRSAVEVEVEDLSEAIAAARNAIIEFDDERI